MDSLFMRLNLPSNIAVKGVTYGTPRVGNPAWATFFDSEVRRPARSLPLPRTDTAPSPGVRLPAH